MRLVLLKEIPEDAHLRQEWNELAMRVEHPQVFYTYEWALAVQRAYGTTLHPLVVLARDEQESLCGIAALASDDRGKVSFLCATTGDYCDFLSRPEYKPVFVTEVLEALQKQGIRELTLTNLPADSDTVVALRQASGASGYRYYARTAYVCAQVAFGRLKRDDDGKPIAPGLKRLRRFSKAMAPDAPVAFTHGRSWDTVAPTLPEFMQAHVARFLEIGRISNLANARRREFLTELGRLLSGPQWLVFSRMTAGERTVAWHYGFKFCGTWFWYQPTFDSAVEKHWPGFCLLSQVIQDATEDPSLTTLDLGLGSEAYKAKFANESRETLYITLRGSLLQHLGVVLRHRVSTSLRARPRAERLASLLREQFREFRRHVQKEGITQALTRAAKRLLRPLWSHEEVLFFEWGECGRMPVNSRNLQLRPLDLNDLAAAVMQYEEDDETLGYLLRSTQRLRAGGAMGFVLAGENRRPLHFAWVTAFDGFFLSELNARVEAPAVDCAMIFDCWTPSAERGHGYYARAVEMVAEHVQREGKRPWIFSAASNESSVRGLEKSGFERRYSLVRQRMLGRQRILGKTPKTAAAAAARVSANV